MSTTNAAAATTSRRRLNLASLQWFGRSLMLPIAALPVAALLLRLGQADLLGADGLGWVTVAAVVGAAGNAVFSNLPLLFALGVAIGMAQKADGSTALAAVVGYLVFKGVGDAMSPFVLGLPAKGAVQDLITNGVLGGILIGLTAGCLWQRYRRISLPPYLAFFGGRRFVPIVTAFAAIALSVALSLLYPVFNSGLTSVGTWVTDNDVVGGFVYGTLNRLLIPLGLHHIAAALATWHEAKPQHRKAVGGIMLSAALTSFPTGVTEPLEFAFMFVAWPLSVMHAVLTGTALALVNALGVRDGYGFSAGLFDYLLNVGIATQPLLLVVVGLGFAAVYYVSFRFVIRRWNLRTPGREDDDAESAVEADGRA